VSITKIELYAPETIAPGKRLVALGTGRIVNSKHVLPQVDDKLDRSARQNPHLEMRLSVVVIEPEVVDEISERMG